MSASLADAVCEIVTSIDTGLAGTCLVGLRDDEVSRVQARLRDSKDPKNGYAKTFLTMEDFSSDTSCVNTATAEKYSALAYHWNGIQECTPSPHFIVGTADEAGQLYLPPGHDGQSVYPQSIMHSPHRTSSLIHPEGQGGLSTTLPRSCTLPADTYHQRYSLDQTITAPVRQQQTHYKSASETEFMIQFRHSAYQPYSGHSAYQPYSGHSAYPPSLRQLDPSINTSAQCFPVAFSNDLPHHPYSFPPQQLPSNAPDKSHFPATTRNGIRSPAKIGGAAFRPSMKETHRPPVKRAVVILQGQFSDADAQMLRQCLGKMGFANPHVYWESEKTIPKERLEREMGKLVDGLTAGSNLLLIIATLNINGIALDERFLMEQIYRKIARDNKMLAEQREKNERAAKNEAFDSSYYEGVTLHVVLDGVLGCVLPEALCFEPEKGNESTGLRATWVRVPKGTKSCSDLLSKKNGRIVQICSDARRSGHSSGHLLSAFVCAVNDQAYLPYNHLAYQILDLTNHYFCQTYEDVEASRDKRRQMIRGHSARTGGEIVSVSICAMMALYAHCKMHSEKRAKDTVASMLAKGEMVLSSANRFDPNLCVDVDWNEDDIPLIRFSLTDCQNRADFVWALK